MKKTLGVFLLLSLASLNALAEPIDEVDLRIETFQGEEGSKVFYQTDTISTKITVTNNSSDDLPLEVEYELDAAEGEFTPIQEDPVEITVPAKGSYIITDSFSVPQEIASGTFIVKARVKEQSQNPGPENSVTGNSFITIFSGSPPEVSNVPETSFFLLPIIGFMALFLIKRRSHA